eukprot:749952-Hanusia_phi.AAC.1
MPPATSPGRLRHPRLLGFSLSLGCAAKGGTKYERGAAAIPYTPGQWLGLTLRASGAPVSSCVRDEVQGVRRDVGSSSEVTSSSLPRSLDMPDSVTELVKIFLNSVGCSIDDCISNSHA